MEYSKTKIEGRTLMTITPSTLDELAHEIAERCSKELIESASVHVADSTGAQWYNISGPEEFEQEALDEAVRYLDLAGILHRSTENPQWVGWDED